MNFSPSLMGTSNPRLRLKPKKQSLTLPSALFASNTTLVLRRSSVTVAIPSAWTSMTRRTSQKPQSQQSQLPGPASCVLRQAEGCVRRFLLCPKHWEGTRDSKVSDLTAGASRLEFVQGHGWSSESEPRASKC
uniref:Carbonic anhydrase 13 n=1 Tax=Molossus molossus TaxID=27622 RepID=A0A7J8DSD0_MOLMO|nr:carbonic anhydrase 13 [Molossus molossus]